LRILDSQSLQNGIAELINGLSTEGKQIYSLQREIEAFIHLDDSFEGKGGAAIRAFYEDFHRTLLSAFSFILEDFERTLSNIQSAAGDLEPDDTGYIQQSFLSHDLKAALRKGENLTLELVDEANCTIRRVSDIVYSPTLQENRFTTIQQQAQNKIDQTIEDLTAFDIAQTKELDTVEQNIQLLKKYLYEVNGMFKNGTLNINKYDSSTLDDSKLHEEINSFQKNRKISAAWDMFFSPFDTINSKMSWGDNLLAGYQTLSVLSAGVFSSKLKVHYLGSKPTLWQKLRGKYEFSVRTDPSWTSKGKHSSKLAKKILTFSRAETPSNPLLKQLHGFVKTYESPAHIYKHVAGFPKNFNKLTGEQLRKNIYNRMTTGTKEVLGKTASAKGLTTVGKKIPFVGTAVSFIANAGEFTSSENANMGSSEKIGRFVGGVGTDLAAIAAGTQLGATIGSIG
jgi:toxin YxiD